MKKFLAVLALLLTPALSWAEAATVIESALNINVQSVGTLVGCRVFGQAGDSRGGPILSLDQVQTAGASTTITSVNNLNPFGASTGMATGDILLFFTQSGAYAQRTVITITNPNSIVVDTAITLAPQVFRWYHQTCGSTINDGWIDVSQFYEKDLLFQGDTIGAAQGIDVRWECMMSGPYAQPVQVFPACPAGACNTVQNYVTGGEASRTNVVIYEPWQQCRALFDVHGGAAGTNAITVKLTGRIRKP